MDPLHSRTIYVAHIAPEEYHLFHAGMLPDLRLPPTYQEWQGLTIRRHAAYQGDGYRTEAVFVSWKELCTHAKRARLPPAYALLTAYAIYKAHKGDCL